GAGKFRSRRCFPLRSSARTLAHAGLLMVVLAVRLALAGLRMVRRRAPLGGGLLPGRAPTLAPGRQVEHLGGGLALGALLGSHWVALFGELGRPSRGPVTGPVAGMGRRRGREGRGCRERDRRRLRV